MLPANQNAKSYPCIKLTLCNFLFEATSIAAEENHRSAQKEITHRLIATFFNDIEYRVRAAEIQTSTIIAKGARKQNLTLSRDMIDLLAASAMPDNHSLDEEVFLRLLVSFVNPAEMGLNTQCENLIRNNVINEQKDREKIALMAMFARLQESTQK